MRYTRLTDADDHPMRRYRCSPTASLLGVAAVAVVGYAYVTLRTPVVKELSDADFMQQPKEYSINNRSRSGWYNDNGVLDFDAETGLNTTWTTVLDDEKAQSAATSEFYCDEKRVLHDGRATCSNHLKLLKALKRHTEAENAVLLAPSYRSSIELSASAQDVLFLGGRRILVVGDSIERNVVSDFAEYFNESSWITGFWISDKRPNAVSDEKSDDSTTHEDAETSEDQSSKEDEQPLPAWPRFGLMQSASLVLPIAASDTDAGNVWTVGRDLDMSAPSPLPSKYFRIDFVFLTGSLEDEYARIFNYAPTDSMERLVRLFDAVGVRNPRTGFINSNAYDTITTNFAFKELHPEHREVVNSLRNDTKSEFSLDMAETLANSLEEMLGYLRKTFPPAQLNLRVAHDVVSPQHYYPKTPNQKASGDPPKKPARVFQLRSIQQAVAQKLGIKTVPFTRLDQLGRNCTFDGFHPYFPANRMYIELLLRNLYDHVT